MITPLIGPWCATRCWPIQATILQNVEDVVVITSRDAAGRANRMVGTETDITASKQAEQQIAFQARVLSEISDAVIVTDNDEESTISDWNAAAEQMYGWPAEEVIGKSSHSLRPTLASRIARRLWPLSKKAVALPGK